MAVRELRAGLDEICFCSEGTRCVGSDKTVVFRAVGWRNIKEEDVPESDFPPALPDSSLKRHSWKVNT